MKTLLITLLLIVSSIGFSQNANWCGTDAIIQSQLNANPSLQNVFHQGLMNAAQTQSTNSRGTVVIPVVVHIIHDNGIGNISNAQVENAIQILNEDYTRNNADTTQTRQTGDAPFKNVAAGMDIEFVLAKRDEQGNCTNGIVRVNAPHLTYDAGEDCKDASLGGSDQWNPYRYFNIWIVNSIDNGGGAGITLGYAYFPYNGPGSGYGILMRHDAFGLIGTAAHDGRTLTHEMGHALGLPHIFDGGFGGANGCHTGDCATNGDYSCDTPPQAEANWSCSQTWNSCTNVPIGDAFGYDVFDQIENYMSYNSCQNMFSTDQVNIMTNNINTIDFLDSLRTDYTHTLTGVFETTSLCQAMFDTDKKLVCTGEPIQTIDFSFHNPSSWAWNITPGTEGVDFVFSNGSSSSQEPEITFLKGGVYSVELVVSDGVNSASDTQVDLITVVTEPASLPFIEGFESYTSLNNTTNWIVYNPENNAAFELYTGTGHSGNKCVRLGNYGQLGSNSDELIASPVDLSGVNSGDPVTLSFRYAYRKKQASNDEWLKVFASSDCGESWNQRKAIHGTSLSNIETLTSWTPSTQDDWVTVHVTNILSPYFTENFRYKFEFESDNGNNFYLDDINIYEGTPSDVLVGLSIEENQLGGFSIYPNPTDKDVTVRFDIGGAMDVMINVTDLAGKTIQTQQIQGNAGSNLVFLDVSDLSSGTYLIQLNSGSQKLVKRLTIR